MRVDPRKERASARIMTVTPEAAKKWLDATYRDPDEHQKYYHAETFERYCMVVERGEWQAGTERRPIRIRGGQVQDGYHRLRAIVSCGKSVDMLVWHK